MAQDKLHVVPHGDGWAVKAEGKDDVESTHPTQKEAIEAGRESAQRADADLVIHRADGTFRKVYTIGGEEEMNDRTSGKNRRVETNDLVSVGTRISWGAILAGAAVALSMIIMLGVLGAATGLTLRNRMSDQGYFIGAMICSMVVLLGSLFLGGFIASRITAGEDKTEAMTYGVVVWAVLFVGLAVLTPTGANVGYNTLAISNEAQASLPSNLFEGMKSPLSQEQVEELRAKYRNATPDISPTTAAWWTFASILLSMAASILGSVAGAGPTLFFRQYRERYAQHGTASAPPVAQPSVQTASR